MARNLLKELYKINSNNESDIFAVRSVMEERLCFLEDREPEYDGEVHDLWEEKCDAIQEIIDSLEQYEEAENFEEKSDAWDAARDGIEDYQMTYGGLSRLKI